jgi:hypothetical protein
VASLLLGHVSAEESQYMMRIHRNFIKKVADKNIGSVLNKFEEEHEKNVILTEVNAKVDELDMKIVPPGHKWDEVASDLFFDKGQLVLEINNLEFKGHGKISDPETGI